MNLTRVQPIGIQPLELWDLCVGSGILWDHMKAADFGQVLRERLIEVWRGTARTRSEGALPASVKGFTSLYLTGGGASSVAEFMMDGPWRQVIIGSGAVFAGETGGRILLAQHGLTGWVMDLGQSTLKISAGDRHLAWPRDLEKLTVRRNDEDAASITSQRAAIRQFLAGGLEECLQATGESPTAIVCALPSRLDESGIPEGSSYIGMKDDATLLPETLALAGLAQTRILVLNDAELAAVSASQDPRIHQHCPALVLTIGFGVGAALITRPHPVPGT